MNINLLPWRNQQQQRRCYRFYGLWFITVLLCVGGCVFWVISTRLQQQNQPLTAITTPQQNASWLLLWRIIHQRQSLLPALKVITDALPPHVYLTALQYQLTAWTLTGRAKQAKAVLQFSQHLQQARAYFQHVTLTEMSQQHHVTFHLQLHDAH